MALSDIDRILLDRCMNKQPKAWNDFVDRFMGLVMHVINHTSRARSIRLTPQDRDDLAAEVFLEVIGNEFAVLRNFRGQSSLATYLTVVARRVVVRELLRSKSSARLTAAAGAAVGDVVDQRAGVESMISDRDQVEQLIGQLEGAEADVVRLYHLEGKSYYEISMATGMPENSIGPMLSRARGKLRSSGAEIL